ncbi:MAG TPA: 50S ribosomal protein L24 [Bryobacteraceae bacterium]|jgi:large subunit ribosomal protein L24|nr:50S ribosomal protein L24 [Bryobacteraceae bacterium]
MSQKLLKDKRPPVRIQLKKDDQVKVIAGRDRGKTGRILSVDSVTGRVVVEHVNMIKRHTRKNPAKQIAGGIAEKEAAIAVSNVMILCGKCGPARIGHHVTETPGGKARRMRICRKCGQTLDK